MTVGSLPFLIGLVLLASLIFFLPTVRARQCFLALCNAGFLYANVPTLTAWLAMAAFVLSGYAIARLVRRCSLHLRWVILASYISALVMAFAVLKGYKFLEVILPTAISDGGKVAIVGLSYMLFRQIHFVVDTAEDQIEEASLWDYLNYQFNLFALMAGPIQRFQDFRASWTTLSPLPDGWQGVMRAYCRLLLGFIKVGLLGTLILTKTESNAGHSLYIGHPSDIARFAVVFYGYPAYIFVNFSGYCDIVIAGASLVGLRLPENFNRPYVARNMIDYWSRWHMSLTHWIRDYIFTPLYKNCVQRWPQHSQLATNGGYFIALFLAGVWHGSTWNFVIFGLLNGVGVATTKAWESFIIRRRGRNGLRLYLQNRTIHVIAVVATLHFVFITILFFPSDLSGRIAFLHHFFTGHDYHAAVAQ